MSFVSWSYYLFLAVLLLLYYILPRRICWAALLAASLLFSLQFSVYSTIWLVATSAFSYLAALAIVHYKQKGSYAAAKSVLLWSLLLLFGSLFLIKYLPLLSELWEKSARANEGKQIVPYMSIVLPVGISFYLLQVTGYLIDVYRQKTGFIRHFGHYCLSVSFFAKLAQGPVTPVGQLAPQFAVRKAIDPAALRSGCFRMLAGLIKKVVIADRLAVIANNVFAKSFEMNALSICIGIVFYSFQLYADFSGYTDIAIGSAQLFGISLPENFRQPYLARSIADRKSVV